MLPTHLNLPTVRATTVRLDTPVVGSLWVPCNIDVPSHLLAEREKALCVFLNSSIGILSLLGDRTNKKPTYPNLSIDDLRKLTVPNFTAIGEKRNPDTRIGLRLARQPHPPHPVANGLLRHPPRTRRRRLRRPPHRPRNRPHHPPQPRRRAVSHRQAIHRNECLMSLSHFRETIFLNHDSNNSAISNSHQCQFGPWQCHFGPRQCHFIQRPQSWPSFDAVPKVPEFPQNFFPKCTPCCSPTRPYAPPSLPRSRYSTALGQYQSWGPP